jgi:hypothetical protein
MPDKAIAHSTQKSGTLVTGGFRLLDSEGRVIKEGHLPDSPRVEVSVDYSEVDK